MICRLCLKTVTSESVVKLYHEFNSTMEAMEMVKLIEKYLDIEVTKDDVVSTMICMDCYDHVDDFHRFRENVTEKQIRLRNECSDVEPKKEYHTDGGNYEQAIFEYPIDVVKTEMVDEEEIVTADLLDPTDLNKEDVLAKSEYCPDDIRLSDDDIPLLKRKKKIPPPPPPAKRKRMKNNSDPKPKEPKKKESLKKYIPAQEIIAKCMKLKCDICEEEEVNTWKELREHFLLAHTRTPYIKCCDTIYEKQRQLADHLLWHKNPEEFKCKVCNEILLNSKDLTAHISKQHPENVEAVEIYECEHCCKQFRSIAIYNNHLRKHSKEDNLECQICNKRLETAFELHQHIDTDHKDNYFHICDICGKKFKCKDSFKKHYQIHQGIVEPAVQCSICNKWLKNYHSLRIHRLQHEEHPRKCDICNREFKTQRSWKKHVQYWHEMEKNLPCSFCDKVFREKRNLDEHMATHTGAQLYTCPHCSKESRSKSNMYAHVKRQHPDEWWKSKVDRLNLDPSTSNPILSTDSRQQQEQNQAQNRFMQPFQLFSTF